MASKRRKTERERDLEKFDADPAGWMEKRGYKGTPQAEVRTQVADRAKRSRERRNQLTKRWPKGKKKSQVVLEHIAAHPDGLTTAEIRQFVWEMNGHRERPLFRVDRETWTRVPNGKTKKAPSGYWMGMLLYDETNDGKLRLLPGWCVKDGDRWKIRPGAVIKPPFFLTDMSDKVTVADFRRILRSDPRDHGIRFHNEDGCTCPIPDDHFISFAQVEEPWRRTLEQHRAEQAKRR